MRRNWVRRNKESSLFLLSVLCLSILLIFGMKEQLLRLVYPGVSYIAEGYDKEEKSWIKAVVSYANGYYGYAQISDKLQLYTENADGIERALTQEELNMWNQYGLHNVDTANGANEIKSLHNYETVNSEREKVSLHKNILSYIFGNNNSDINEMGDNISLHNDDADEFETEINGSLHNEGLSADSSMDSAFLSDDLEAEILTENGVYKEFIKADTKARVLDYEKLLDYTYLRKHFYTVDPSTDIGASILNARKMMEYDATISQDNSKPQILIYHTHSQEAFLNSTPGDPSTSIVGVGEKLAQVLREEYGFNVIHHTGVYDGDSRDYAYSAAAPALEQILSENPSIEVIIDLHRDGVAESTHLVTEVGGRRCAQFMFFNGVSYLNSTGNIAYLENPYIEENLAFSFQMKLAADEYYPGFARGTYLKGLRYNMHYRPKSLLIEMGAQTNTVEEVMNAVDPLAHILSMVLKGEKP